MNEDELKEISRRLCRAIGEAIYHWRFFCVLLDYSGAIRNGTLRPFKSFLTSTHNAHLYAAIVGLYTFLDNNGSKYVTLKSYASRALVAGHKDFSDGVDNFFDKHKGSIESVTLLRHQYVAHRPIKRDELAAFEEANVIVPEVSRMADDLSALHAQIGVIGGQKFTSPPCEEVAREEVMNFMELVIEALLRKDGTDYDKLKSEMS